MMKFERRAQVGARFPEFTLPDLDGRTWCLDDLRRQRTVMFCFASW
jgi:peroxiredoxin